MTSRHGAESGLRLNRRQFVRAGGRPKEHPVAPADIYATVFAALGCHADQISYQSSEGRPYPLSQGTPIRGLLSYPDLPRA